MWTAELQLGMGSWWGSGAWSCSEGDPDRRLSGLRPPGGSAAPRTAELQLGMGSWWEPGAWSCSGRYPERRPSGLPPPTGVVVQRRPIRAVSGSGREGNDRPARASGGLPGGFNDAPWVRSPWIAKHAHCAQRASGREVDGGHNGVHGTSRPRRWGARVGEVVGTGAPELRFGAGRRSGGASPTLRRVGPGGWSDNRVEVCQVGWVLTHRGSGGRCRCGQFVGATLMLREKRDRLRQGARQPRRRVASGTPAATTIAFTGGGVSR